MNTENIGKNLKEIITALGLTQAEAAEQCGVSQAALSQIIHGMRLPSVSTMVQILKAFNVKFERLLK